MKTVCMRHEQAYEVGDRCPYCQPATATKPPPYLADDDLLKLQRWAESMWSACEAEAKLP